MDQRACIFPDKLCVCVCEREREREACVRDVCVCDSARVCVSHSVYVCARHWFGAQNIAPSFIIILTVNVACH